MNKTQATRPIRKGSRWNDGYNNVTITKANTLNVYFNLKSGGVGVSESWYFRDKFTPGWKKEEAPKVPDWILSRDMSDDYLFYRAEEKPGIVTPEMLLAYRGTCDHGGEKLIGKFEGTTVKTLPLVIRITDLHYSIGAEHYYACVKLPQVYYGPANQPNRWLMAAGIPSSLNEVTCTVILTQTEIARAPHKYKHYKAGERYPGFRTPAEALASAQQWINTFTKGFHVTLEADEEYGLKLFSATELRAWQKRMEADEA